MSFLVWRGSPTDWMRLKRAVHANCSCEPATEGTLPNPCSTCDMLDDQAVLDRLQFGAFQATRLLLEEWNVEGPA